VGAFIPDLIVEDLVIVEVKAGERLAKVHEVQRVNYLRATPIEVGFVVNFGAALDFRRRVFTHDRKAAMANPRGASRDTADGDPTACHAASPGDPSVGAP